MDRHSVLADVAVRAGLIDPVRLTPLLSRYEQERSQSWEIDDDGLPITFERWLLESNTFDIPRTAQLIEQYAGSKFVCGACGYAQFGQQLGALAYLTCASCGSGDIRLHELPGDMGSQPSRQSADFTTDHPSRLASSQAGSGGSGAATQAPGGQDVLHLEPGTVLAECRVEEKVGEGGMGVVYRATDIDLERPVAIKILSPKLLQNAAQVKKFRQEAKTLARMENPNVLMIYRLGTISDRPFLVMQWVEGESLAERLKRLNGPLPLRHGVEVLLQAARGLAAAHAKGIVHRDVKPDNLMITEDGVVKVADFGLAKEHAGDDDSAELGVASDAPAGNIAESPLVSRAGQFMGTPAYVAPEQAQGKDTDHRADIYALAITAFQVLVGRLPFRATSLPKLLMHHVKTPMPSTRDTNIRVPLELDQLIQHMAAKKPEDRPQTMKEVARQFQDILKKLPDTDSLGPATQYLVAGDASLSLESTLPANIRKPSGTRGRTAKPVTSEEEFEQRLGKVEQLMELMHFEEALAELQPALAFDASNTRANHNASVCKESLEKVRVRSAAAEQAEQAGDLDAAFEAYKKLQEVVPNGHPAFARTRAISEAREAMEGMRESLAEGDFTGAAQHVGLVAGQYPDAPWVATLHEELRRAKAQAEEVAHRIEEAFALDDIEAAKHDLQAMQEEMPGNRQVERALEQLRRRKTAKEQARLAGDAKRRVGQGRFRAAERLLQQLDSLSPDDARSIELRATIRTWQKRRVIGSISTVVVLLVFAVIFGAMAWMDADKTAERDNILAMENPEERRHALAEFLELYPDDEIAQEALGTATDEMRERSYASAFEADSLPLRVAGLRNHLARYGDDERAKAQLAEAIETLRDQSLDRAYAAATLAERVTALERHVSNFPEDSEAAAALLSATEELNADRRLQGFQADRNAMLAESDLEHRITASEALIAAMVEVGNPTEAERELLAEVRRIDQMARIDRLDPRGAAQREPGPARQLLPRLTQRLTIAQQNAERDESWIPARDAIRERMTAVENVLLAELRESVNRVNALEHPSDPVPAPEAGTEVITRGDVEPAVEQMAQSVPSATGLLDEIQPRIDAMQADRTAALALAARVAAELPERFETPDAGTPITQWYEAIPVQDELRETAADLLAADPLDPTTAWITRQAISRLDSILNERPVQVPGFTHLRIQSFQVGTRRYRVHVYRQDNWAEAIELPPVPTERLSRENPRGAHTAADVEFVLLPPIGETTATFTMGSPADEAGRDDDERQRSVTLTKRFLIARTETTNRIWTQFEDRTSLTRNPMDPVHYLDWNQATSFTDRFGLRLPTEAEWEFAARSGSDDMFAFGDDVTRRQALRGRRADGVQWRDASEGQPNAFGLINVHGNVSEWVRDVYDNYDPDDLTDPVQTAEGPQRVHRGGGFTESDDQLRSASRSRLSPEAANETIGFRAAASVPDGE